MVPAEEALMGYAPILASTLLVTAAVVLSLWAVSVARRDASIIDLYWGPGFALIAAVTALLADGAPARRLLVLALTVVWGLRLGGYLLWRNWGRGEDFRYRAMREQHGPRFARRSLVTVFGFQGLLMWVISLPVQVAQISPEPVPLGWLDALGCLLWSIGLLFESVGDFQMARFKADPENAGRVMDRGLWQYTRHPNYFGDFLVWWGLFVVALAVPYGAWTVVSPILMSVLLMRVSGVPLLEQSLRERRPGYQEYVERTPSFFPWRLSR
jgi:steroid 5-alpha reductase family enzyme